MSRVLYIVTKIFNQIFVTPTLGKPLVQVIIDNILLKPYILIPVVLLIIGFSIGLIKRIIHS